MNFQAMHKQRKFILILAAVGAISVFLPWFTVSAEGLGVRMSESENGFHGTGVLVFLAFVTSAILALLGDQTRIMDRTMWMADLCAGAVALLFVIINLVRTSGSSDGFGFAHAGPGFGIWISLLSSVGTLAAAWVLRNPADTLKGGFDSLKNNLSSISGTGSTTSSGSAGAAGSTGTSRTSGSTAPGGPTFPNSNKSSLNGSENLHRMDDLEKLIELRNQGKITEEEYQRMKSRL